MEKREREIDDDEYLILRGVVMVRRKINNKLRCLKCVSCGRDSNQVIVIEISIPSNKDSYSRFATTPPSLF